MSPPISFLVLVVSASWPLVLSQLDLPSCDSKVFCQGPLLHTVQMARLFNDSKSFVDMNLINSEAETLNNFEILMNSTNQNPSKAQLEEFVAANFIEGNEFETWTPGDWTSNPPILNKITDAEVKMFAQELVNIWPILARKVKAEVSLNPDKYTLIPVDNGFIVPGGRFKEFYYWDSYWIVKGLLLCGMNTTVKGMLDNFLSLVQRFGFIPNGSRIYYLNRSQPPLITLMAADYIQTTNDTEWLANNIDLLNAELNYWLEKKTVEVRHNDALYTMAHYDSESGSPRPESYREDVLNAEYYPDETAKAELYADLKSGAESGWDFSSRWIVDNQGGNNANISYVKTRRIIPVDLNAILCKSFRVLSDFHVRLGNIDDAIFWLEKALLWQKTIEQVLWDETDGIWYDYDMVLEQHRRYFYPSNFAPLWANAFDPADASVYGRRAAQYFRREGIMEYPGGIPSSLGRTGEQWDLPNAWAPLQSFTIFGLEMSGDPDAQSIAEEFANRWINANMIGFNETNEMFEKYDAENPGQYGGGGEYVIQTGFGWTNGAAFELIDYFYTAGGKKYRETIC